MKPEDLKHVRDFKGQKLCRPCWDGCHYISDTVSRKKISNCEGGECQCHCRKMLEEKVRRPKRDKSLQTVIDTGNDVITVGTEAHRDEN